MLPRARDVVGGWFPALFVAGLVSVPWPVAAWTDASVRSVKADVRVDAEGGARVALRVGVQVHAGWLEGLELAGLDPGLALDPAAPPVVIGESGAVFTPTASLRPDADGTTRVQLAFPRRGAPRRGAYEVNLAYATTLAHRATEASGDGRFVRVRWTLPPWQTGLDGVEVALDVPGRATAAEVPGGDGAQPARPEVTVAEGRTRVLWRRPHLPRSTAWSVVAEVPAAALAASLRERERPRARATGRGPTPAWPTLLAVAFGVLLVAGLSARARAAALARIGWRARPLVALSRHARALGLVALVAATPAVASAHPALAVLPLAGLVALLLVTGIHAPDTVSGPRASLRVVQATELRAAARASRRARWLSADALFDATTIPGLAFLLLGAALATRVAGLAPPSVAPIVPLAALLAAVPFFVLTGRSRPASAAAALLDLARYARSLRVVEDAPYALSLCVPADGELAAAPQLRVVPADVPDGFVLLAFAHAHDTASPSARPERLLVAVVRRGSDADDALAPVIDALTLSRRSDATHVTRLLPSSACDDLLRALAAASARATTLLDADALRDDDVLSALLFADDVREDNRPSPCRSSDPALAG